MDLFKKLRKGMSVLLVASMITGMMFPTSGVIVYAEETGGAFNQGTEAGNSGTVTEPTESEQQQVFDKDIKNLAAIDLFKAPSKVVGSKLTIAGTETNVLSVSGGSLSVAIKQDEAADWTTAVTNANNAYSNSGIFTQSSSSSTTPETNSVSVDGWSERIEFSNATNRMLSVKDVLDLSTTAAGKKALAALVSDIGYWLGSEVVDEKEADNKYSVAAYVKKTADTTTTENTTTTEDIGSIDIADKTALKNVYVKTNTDKVKYIYVPADMTVGDWRTEITPEGSDYYEALYALSENVNGKVVLQHDDLICHEEEGKYHLVADTTIKATCPVGTDKVLVAILKQNTDEIVRYQVVKVPETTSQSLTDALEIDIRMPKDVVGEGSLKMIAFSTDESTKGRILGEANYKIAVEAKQELKVEFASVNDESKYDLTLEFKDNDANKTENENASSEATATNSIKLKVTKPNYYAEPVIEDFLLSTETDATKVERSSNEVTSVTISQYESNAEGSTLTVNSTTNFTATEMQTYVAEKEVYLYCLNQNTEQYIQVGKITIDRKYESKFAYKNDVNSYQYGYLNDSTDETTGVNTNLSMDIVSENLKGVHEFLSSKATEATETSVKDITEKELLKLSRTKANGKQFSYTQTGTTDTTTADCAINVGTYTTKSTTVNAWVYPIDNQLVLSTDSQGENSVFKFIITNTGERAFAITQKEITLQTKDQTVTDNPGNPISAPQWVTITGASTNDEQLAYSDETLEVSLKKQQGEDGKNYIHFANFEESNRAYNIKDKNGTDITYNYAVTLSDTYGLLTTTKLSAMLEADQNQTLTEDENNIPVHTVVYDGQKHYVTASACKVTDTNPNNKESVTGATVTYSLKSDFSDGTTVKPEFTEAGTYTVYYKVELADYNDYTGCYKVKIQQKTVNIQIKDQTYQYTNVPNTSYFTKFDPNNPEQTIEVDANNALLEEHKITVMTLTPILNDENACTGAGHVKAIEKSIVVMDSNNTQKTSNYQFKISPGQLEIKKPVVTVDIDDISGEYKAGAFDVVPNIGATYENSYTDIYQADVYYCQSTEELSTENIEKDRFVTDIAKLDLTNVGNSIVYYYAATEGYEPSEIKSFKVDITKKKLDITLTSQTVTYPATPEVQFNTQNKLSYANAQGLIDGHQVQGTIKVTQNQGTPEDQKVYQTGILSIAVKENATDILDVTVFDVDDQDVTKNYQISDTSDHITYTINKKDFDGISAQGYAGQYDSEYHNSVIEVVSSVAGELTDAQTFYCLFKKSDFDKDASLDTIKDSRENQDDKVWSKDIPRIKNVGDYVVAYKIVKNGYNDYKSSIPATILQAALTLMVKPQTANYDRIVLKPSKETILNYVNPIGIVQGDCIESIEFASEALSNSSNGIISNGDIDVKKSGEDYEVVIKDGEENVTPNYKITSISNILTVTQSKFDVKVDTDKQIIYDAQPHTILELLTVNGTPAAELVSDKAINIQCSTDAINYSDVNAESNTITTPGTLKLYYKITAKGYGEYLSVIDLTVQKKELPIEISNQSVVYGVPLNSTQYKIKTEALSQGHDIDDTKFALTVDKSFANGLTIGQTPIKHNGQIVITDAKRVNVTDCYQLTPTTDAYYTVSEATISDEMLSVIVDNSVSTETFKNSVVKITNNYKAEVYTVAITPTAEAAAQLKGYSVTYSVNNSEETQTNGVLSFINAGTYEVTATINATGYASKEVGVTFIINPQKLEIALADQTISYGGAIAQALNEYGNISSDKSTNVLKSITGLQGLDTIRIPEITKTENGDLTFDKNQVKVDYANDECLNNTNYDIIVKNAKLTETERVISVQLKDWTLTDAHTYFDNAMHSWTITDSKILNEYITVEGLCNGDSVTSATFTYDSTSSDPEDDFTSKYSFKITSVIIMNGENNVTDKYQLSDDNNTGNLFVVSMPVHVEGYTGIYDGKSHPMVTLTVVDGYENLFGTESAKISFEQNSTSLNKKEVMNVDESGTYKVTVQADGYKPYTKDVEVKIEKAPLFIIVKDQPEIELSGKILQVGDPSPSGNKTAVVLYENETAADGQIEVVRIQGLVKGQTVDNIHLSLQKTMQVGHNVIQVDSNQIWIGYENTAGNEASSTQDNYNVLYTNGSVNVRPQAFAIKIDDKAVDSNNETKISHTYDGTSALDGLTITPDPDKLTIQVIKDNAINTYSSLADLKNAIVDAGSYLVTIRAEKANYTTVQATISVTIAKAQITAKPIVTVQSSSGSSTTDKFVVPEEEGTSYGLAVNVTSGNTIVDSKDYTITYATSEEGSYGSSPVFTGAGKYTVYYQVTPSSNYAIESEIGSVDITICNHKESTFTFVSGNEYGCNTCDGKISYDYKVLGVAATLISENGNISNKISNKDQQLLVGQDDYQPKAFGPNTEVELNATSYKTGTNIFLGWYSRNDLTEEESYYVITDGVKPVSTSLKWVYTSSLDKQGSDSYIAVFKQNITTVTLTAEPADSNGTVTITVGNNTNTVASGSKIVQGSTVTVTAVPNNTYKFAYWTNELGIVVSNKENYSFSLTGDTIVKAVFIETGKVTVNTYNKYGQSINTQSFTAGTTGNTINIVNAPAVLDFAFIGWKLQLVNGDTVKETKEYKLKNTTETNPQPVTGGDYENTNLMNTALQTTIAEIVKNQNNENCEVKLTALYQEAKKTEFTVTVVNGTITNYNAATSVNLTTTTVITVKPDKAEAGKKFSHWEVSGKPVSYNETYSFYASEAITVTAIYVDDAQEVEAQATTDMTNFAVIDSTAANKNRFAFTSTATVPKGCTIEKAGMYIWRKTESVTNSTELGTATATVGSSSTAATCSYTCNLSMSYTQEYVLYVQSYVSYVNENGERKTVVGDYYEVKIPNNKLLAGASITKQIVFKPEN